VRLYLVRHGESTYNRDGLGLGREDAPLTDLGLRQTAAAVERLAAERFDRILTSPLGRASAIARGLAERTGAPLEVREGLVEMDVGETEGLPFREMRERFPDFLDAWRAADPSEVLMPGGESLAQVAARLEPLAAELHTLPDDETVVAVSHNFVLRLLICRLLGFDIAAFRAFSLDLASISTLSLRSGQASLRTLNDRCSLPEEPVPGA
jgi:broad specificity phosphatase PhoE